MNNFLISILNFDGLEHLNFGKFLKMEIIFEFENSQKLKSQPMKRDQKLTQFNGIFIDLKADKSFAVWLAQYRGEPPIGLIIIVMFTRVASNQFEVRSSKT